LHPSAFGAILNRRGWSEHYVAKRDQDNWNNAQLTRTSAFRHCPPVYFGGDRAKDWAFNGTLRFGNPWPLDFETVIPEPFVGAIKTGPALDI
jgi:hypothetical protein